MNYGPLIQLLAALKVGTPYESLRPALHDALLDLGWEHHVRWLSHYKLEQVNFPQKSVAILNLAKGQWWWVAGYRYKAEAEAELLRMILKRITYQCWTCLGTKLNPPMTEEYRDYLVKLNLDLEKQHPECKGKFTTKAEDIARPCKRCSGRGWMLKGVPRWLITTP